MYTTTEYRDGEICVDFDEVNEVTGKGGSGNNKNPDHLSDNRSSPLFAAGDPYGNRTRVTAVKGQCLKPLDQRAILSLLSFVYHSLEPQRNLRNLW